MLYWVSIYGLNALMWYANKEDMVLINDIMYIKYQK